MDDTPGGSQAGAGIRQVTAPAAVPLAVADPAAAYRDAVAAFQAGDLGRTAAICRRLVAADGSEARPWHLLGCVHGRRGEPAEAGRCFERAAGLDPANPAYLANLGAALIDLKRWSDAIRTLDRTLAILTSAGKAAPERMRDDTVTRLATAHRRRGDDLIARADPAGAIRDYRQALHYGGDGAEIHRKLASACLAGGAFAEAVRHGREAVRLDPDSIEAAMNLSQALHREGQFGEAGRVLENLARRVPAAAPELYAIRCNLGVCLEAQNEDDRALEQFREAARLAPGEAEPLILACGALITLNRLDEAEAMLGRLVALDPAHPMCAASEGRLLMLRGDLEAAYRRLGAAVADPRTRAASRATFAFVCAETGRAAEGVAAVTAALEGPLDPLDRANLQSVLGRLQDGAGDYDQAFAAYAEANGYRARIAPFDAAALRASTDRLIRVFSAEGFAALPRSRQTSSLPVFIVGMPRSGTSLVEQILDSHPEAHGAGELRHINRIRRALPDRLGVTAAYPECLTGASADALDRIARDHLQTLQAMAPAARRISDKMPDNFRRLGLIALLFPQATIIHCVRDPIDTCLSCFFQDFRFSAAFSFDLQRLVDYYEEYRRLMRHWTGTLTLPVVEVRYEELIADPEPVIRRLVDAVGLVWDDRSLRFFDNPRVVQTASVNQVRKPIYASSVGRWTHYERHLGPLLDGLAAYR